MIMFEKTQNWTSDRDYTLIVIQCPVEEEHDGANWDFSQIEIQISHQLWSIFLTNCDSDFSFIKYRELEHFPYLLMLGKIDELV